MLRTIGYDTTDLTLAVLAFQRHFRTARVDGRVDVETARRLGGLLDSCRG
jgi:N-acetyl-anhydromuramyl-L-alanine amidase AmpD